MKQPLIVRAIGVVDDVLSRVTDWSRPSPCGDWVASDVLGHITGTLDKARVMLSSGAYGGQPADPMGLPGPEAVALWRSTRDQLLSELADADLTRGIQTRFGEQPLGQALARPAADFCTHAWDIAASQGERLELPDDLLDLVRRVAEAVPPAAMRSPGLFGAEVTPAPDAGPTERLMAWLGRRRPAAG